MLHVLRTSLLSLRNNPYTYVSFISYVWSSAEKLVEQVFGAVTYIYSRSLTTEGFIEYGRNVMTE